MREPPGLARLRGGRLTLFHVERSIPLPFLGLEVPALPAPWLQAFRALWGLCRLPLALGAFCRAAIRRFDAIIICFSGERRDRGTVPGFVPQLRPTSMPCRRAAVRTLAFLTVFLALPIAGAASGGEGEQGFEDVTAALGLSYAVQHHTEGEEHDDVPRHLEAAGLALVDIDGNGLLDLYVAHGGGEKGRLFSYDGSRFVARPGNGGIEPATIDLAGYFVDLDQDGHTDFVSINSEGPQAFRNDGAGRFAPAPSPFRVQPWRITHSMAAADYDNDGDLDLFFAHWLSIWNKFKPPSHYLWRNNGRGRYEDVSHVVPVRPGFAPGRDLEREVSFTPTFADIDRDGDLDILLAGDFGTSQVLRNEGGKSFTDIAGHVLTDENGMGSAIFDFDRDGDLDWFVTSIDKTERVNNREPTGNRLYMNVGGADQFVEVSRLAGVRAGGWGWGACAADFDNDGHTDLFHTNGWFESSPIYGSSKDFAEFEEDPSRLFMSNGDGTFTERAAALGIDHSGQGRGVVCADYDGDGRVDIFIAIRVTPFGLAPLTGQPSADPAIVASGAKASISLTTSITAGRPAAKAVSSEPARSAGCSTRRPSAPMASAIVAKLTSL